MIMGMTIVIKEFDEANFWRNVNKYRITKWRIVYNRFRVGDPIFHNEVVVLPVVLPIRGSANTLVYKDPLLN